MTMDSNDVLVPIPTSGVPVDPASTAVSVCRFLARVGGDGRLLPPGTTADAAHACVAVGEPLGQSLRQQELLCLRVGHTDCPRYLRGILVRGAPPPPSFADRARRIPIAIVVAILLLVASAGLTVGFVVVHGGFAVPALDATPSPAASAIADGHPSPSAASSPAAASPKSSPKASPRATPRPSPTAAIANASPSWPPGATASRMSLVTPCPGTPDCYLYVVRPDDKLGAIADYFGTTLQRVLQLNPWITDPSVIRVGDTITLPPPTR